jgi:hypothetical protein
MISRSQDQYLTDFYSKDHMDSAVRCGILTFAAKNPVDQDLISSYESNGLIVRCPVQAPANNPKNATRDQLIPLVAGLYSIGNHKAIRRIFWSRMKSLFFMQNTERDLPTSKKYPFPHCFYKDSGPTTETKPMKFNWKTFKFENTIVSSEHTVESKMFDSADPLLPNNIWLLIKAGHIYPLYWFGIVGIPFHLLALYFHGTSEQYEENQMIAECYVLGTLGIFKRWCSKWKTNSQKYWSDRNEIEYHDVLVKFVG